MYIKKMLFRKPATAWPPPKYSPSHLQKRYSGLEAHLNEWNISYINDMIKNHKLHKQIGWYGIYEENLIDETISKYSIEGKDVAVIGSEAPWVEAIIASKNPKSITTWKNKIYNTLFEYFVSHSSLENSGLGRYGDELNPNADIEAAEEVWCMLKKGGFFLIGLPYANKSYIRWNADRNYGPERMKYFGANFKQIEFFGLPWSGQIPLMLMKN